MSDLNSRLPTKELVERVLKVIHKSSSYYPEVPSTNFYYGGGKDEGSDSEPVSKSGAEK